MTVEVYPYASLTLPPFNSTNLIAIGRERYFIVDPATPFEKEQERFDEWVGQLKTQNRHLQGILLTHHHSDHLSDAHRIAQRYQVPLFAHEETAKRLNFPVHRLLKDNEYVLQNEEVGLRCIYTPGHAPGHLCFIEERSHTLIAGDMVAAKGSILIAAPEGHLGSYIDSLERLLTENIQVLIPAHGEVFYSGHQRIHETLTHRLERLQQIETLVQTSFEPLSARKLVQMLYAKNTAPELLPFAEKSVEASLIYLKEHKRLYQTFSSNR